MNKRMLAVLLLFLFPVASAYVDVEHINQATFDYGATSIISVLPNTAVNITYYSVMPQNNLSYLSYVGSIIYDNFSNKAISYYQNAAGTFNWSFFALVNVNRSMVSLDYLTPFPYSYPAEFGPYLRFTNNSDYSAEVCALASMLTTGSANLVDATLKLAQWTGENIVYDLSYENVSKPASWVFTSKRGTCDEYANLFISLCRCVGIAARYAYGPVYTGLNSTSSLPNESFGSHAWAEVYIPSYGWLSIDPTWQEYAGVDATHIKIAHADDYSSLFTYYDTWTGTSEPEISGPDISISLKNYTLDDSGSIYFDAAFNSQKFGPNDYVLFVLNVVNPTSKYVLTQATLSTPENLALVYGNYSKPVLVSPSSNKSVYYIFRAPNVTCGNCYYSYPISVYVAFSTEKTFSFNLYPTTQPGMSTLQQLLGMVSLESLNQSVTPLANASNMPNITPNITTVPYVPETGIVNNTNATEQGNAPNIGGNVPGQSEKVPMWAIVVALILISAVILLPLYILYKIAQKINSFISKRI